MYKNGNKKKESRTGRAQMKWYVTALLLYGFGKAKIPARRCHFLIAADDHESAVRKSRQLGLRRAGDKLHFGGILDLLLIHETLKDGTELLWSQTELLPSELAEHVRAKEEMRAFQQKDSTGSGWYVCSVVLSEIHDEGSHGERTLVWINSYLIKATDREAAYERSIEIGQGQQDESASHACNGEKAHWEFKGIEDIIPVRDKPADAALLWCEDFQATTQQLERMVPEKSQLGVFRWEAEQQQRFTG